MPGCLEPPHPSRTEEARRVRRPCATALAKFTADEPMPRRASTKWTDDFLSLAVPCCLPGDGAPQPARNLVCFALRAPGRGQRRLAQYHWSGAAAIQRANS